MCFFVAGYYGRQNWSWNRYIDAWAGMTDWRIPILPRVTLSGEFYRGRGVGGLGAGIGRPVLFGPGNPFDPSTSIRGLDSAGGWSQLKFQLTPKLELNGVFAEDNAFASDVRGFAVDANNFSTILWAQSWRAGQSGLPAAFRLAAFCRIQTPAQLPVYSGDSATNQVNLSMGVLF